MNLQGTYTIAEAPAQVYQALNDPVILQKVIPGCEKLEMTGADEYDAHLKMGIASIKGSFVGKVRLSDQQPPNRFTLHMEGKGGPGFVKGSAQIELEPTGNATQLNYTANLQVGGLIAAVGSRVIEAVGKKMADEFFKKFSDLIVKKKKG